MRIELAELDLALQNDEFLPHFQPIVELRTGQICGFEVLARWQSPTVQGTFLPQNLISLAESAGLVGALSNRILTKAFAAFVLLPGDLRLSLNVSTIQLTDLTLARQIQDLASKAHLPTHRLTVEITESALLSNLAESQAVARELKEMGCRLSLDDFGTGYSSLAHLQALPFDELKIDRSFVIKMTKKRESRKIVAATVGLAHSLGMTTVAEGIENDQQADMLLWLGSEFGQGYHFGRPGPIEAVSNILTRPPHPAALGFTKPGDDWAVSSLEAFPTQRLAQLQAIYDGAPVGLCFIDCDQRYISLNRKLADMDGASVPAHIGKTVKEMTSSFYFLVEPYIARALAGEAIAGVDFKLPHAKTGSSRWVLCTYQPAFDEADEVIGVSIAVVDITEQKLAENALQESELIQQHIGHLNGQVPWVMDPQGNTLHPSSEWVNAIPAGQAHASNLGWLEAVHIDDLKSTIKQMKRALRTGEPIDMEYRVQNTEGEWRWMRSRGSPRLDPSGGIARWYGSVEDIHESKIAALQVRNQEAKLKVLLKSSPVAIIVADGQRQSIWLTDASATDKVTSAIPTPAEAMTLLHIEQVDRLEDSTLGKTAPASAHPRKPASDRQSTQQH